MTETDVKSCRIALLCGGWSDEREISMGSGKACEKALHQAGFKVVDLYDVAQEGLLTKLEAGKYDVAFIALHGRYGEDGCVQGLLEMMHIPYTFSGVRASAIAAEKELAKTVYRASGIPTPESVTVSGVRERGREINLGKVIEKVGIPAFVKPVSNGSSYGCSRVNNPSDLRKAIDEALRCSEKALVETCIEGTEITVPVLGNAEPTALPVVEIVTGAEFYDLKVKYEPSSMHHVIPARLDADVYAHAQRLAVKAHVALGCSGLSRSDFIIDSTGTPYILETNTVPGMTETSLVPDSARHAGIEFPELCRRLVVMAIEEYAMEHVSDQSAQSGE